MDHGLVFQQALVDAAQLLDIQGCVIDPAPHLLVRVTETRQTAHGLQQRAIVEIGRIQVRQAGEEFTVEHRQTQFSGHRLVAQGCEESPQAQIEIVEALGGVERSLRQSAYPRQAQMLAVEVVISG